MCIKSQELIDNSTLRHYFSRITTNNVPYITFRNKKEIKYFELIAEPIMLICIAIVVLIVVLVMRSNGNHKTSNFNNNKALEILDSKLVQVI